MRWTEMDSLGPSVAHSVQDPVELLCHPQQVVQEAIHSFIFPLIVAGKQKERG